MIITKKNVKKYVEERVIANLPFAASFVKAQPVTKHTYVNNLFRVTLKKDKESLNIYLRQALDHVKAQPEIKLAPQRIFYEGQVLKRLNEEIFEKGIVPKVFFVDEENFILILSDVREDSPVLVDELASGKVHPETGRSLGRTLGMLHGKTWEAKPSHFDLDQEKNQKQLKRHFFNRLEQAKEIDPKVVQEIVDESKKAGCTFVAGDFASKNIFIHPKGEISFVDLERSFVGDPAFDLGFLIGHYLIELGNQPEIKEELLELVKEFTASYREAMQENRIPAEEIEMILKRGARFAGATILYRLYGRAKAGEISEEARRYLHPKGIELLKGKYPSFKSLILRW